jgi:hypothetical protein
MRLTTYLLPLSLLLAKIAAQEIVVRGADGQYNVVDIAPEIPFSVAIDSLHPHLNNSNDFILDFMSTLPQETLNSKDDRALYRDYLIPVSASEKKDISFIINTLGMSSLIKIKKSESAIKKAGKRVDHLHPFRFLICIFTDDEMIASVHAMDGRAWVWSEFKAGIKGTMDTEANNNNLNPEYIKDFATQLGVAPDPIYSIIANRQWDELINLLLSQVKRNANAGRYNM